MAQAAATYSHLPCRTEPGPSLFLIHPDEDLNGIVASGMDGTTEPYRLAQPSAPATRSTSLLPSRSAVRSPVSPALLATMVQ